MIDKITRDTDLAKAGEALKRATQRARELAARTQTPFVTYKDGRVQKRIIVHNAAN